MRRRLKWAAIFVVGLLLLSFASFWTAATAPPPDLPERADAVIALTGGAARIDQALELLATGRADRLYVSGAGDAVGAESIARRRPGLSPDLQSRIHVGHARDTAGNAAESAHWIKASGARSVVLVTAYYHMPRSLLLFRAAAPDAEIWPFPVAPAQAEPDRWWRSARGVSLIVSEWMKYLATLAGVDR